VVQAKVVSPLRGSNLFSTLPTPPGSLTLAFGVG